MRASAPPSERHLRARFGLEGSRELWFTDPRRFGEAFLIDDADLDRALRAARGEPPRPPSRLSRWARWRWDAPRRSSRSCSISPHIAGVGNIYADEALFRARLHPLSPAGSMRPEHLSAVARRGRRRAGGGDGVRAAPRSTTTVTPAERRAPCRTSSSSTPARASPALAVAGRSSGSLSPDAPPTTARAARCGCDGGPAAPSGPSVTLGQRCPVGP